MVSESFMVSGLLIVFFLQYLKQKDSNGQRLKKVIFKKLRG